MGLGSWLKKKIRAVAEVVDEYVDIIDSDDEYVNEATCDDGGVQEESIKGHMFNLWRDPDFSATRSEVILGGDLYDPAIEWLRPHEICDDPEFYTGGGSQFDVVQGSVGDCWMLAALATLSQHEDLLHHVAPPQTFNVDDGYNGQFSFKIYQYGKWIDVIIDDRLPTRNGRLIFVQSAE